MSRDIRDRSPGTYVLNPDTPSGTSSGILGCSRASLALDVMEPIRPTVDAYVRGSTCTTGALQPSLISADWLGQLRDVG
jgi:hypothetical protein